MRILHISRTMGQGGAEKIVYQLCVDNTRDTKYVASNGGCYVKELEIYGIDHYEIPDLNNKDPKSIIQTVRILNRIIKNHNIQIVHSHHRMAAFYTRLLQMKYRKLKHVYTAHNVFYGNRILLKFSLTKAKLVACGETVKKNLVEEYKQNPNKITVIYNSIAPPNNVNECNDSFGEGYTLIGCIGRLSKQKGIDVFLNAIHEVINEGESVKGIIIGDGEDRKRLEGLSESLNVSDHICFLGFRKDVFSLIKKMDFIVLASRWEGFPLTPIETFSMGKTIIASNIPNNLEIVKDSRNGLIFQSEDYVDLANKIMSLISDKERRMKLETNAYQDYLNMYSYNKFINLYLNVYCGEK